MFLFYKLEDFRDEAEIRILTSTFQKAYTFAFLGIYNYDKVDDAIKNVSPPQDCLRLKIDSADCTAIGNSDHPLNQECECVSTNNGRM